MGKKAATPSAAVAPSETDPDQFVTKAWATKHWGVSEDTVERFVARGILPAYRIGKGRNVRFKRSDIDALADRIA
jgi:excisionase family DNA binding protein